MEASLLGPRSWETQDDLLHRAGRPLTWAPGGPAQVELAGSPAGRLLGG